jgi:hypothetical protein
MKLPKQKLWSSDELLELLDDEDIAALWEAWNLPPRPVKSRESPEFRAAINKRARTTLLQEVLSLTTPTLNMLRDVLVFLADHNVALRTTGSLVVLDDEFDIAPQQVDAALKWSASRLRRLSTETWEQIQNQFDREIRPLFKKVVACGAVHTEEEDIIDTYLEGGSLEPETIVSYDQEGFRTREKYIADLEGLNRKLAPIRHLVADTQALRMISVIDQLYREEGGGLFDDQRRIEEADRHRGGTYGPRPTKEDHEAWKRFVEEVLLLAEIEESSTIVDVLRIDLFRKRPQLYELWIVVVILRFMQRVGYQVEMLSLRTTDVGRTVWNLNYAKSQTPIARLFRNADNSNYFLFYQLFRTGKKRDDMPDIALLPSDRHNDTPVWIMDPKHSERRGYSLTDYTTVGLRYQRTFRPGRTWVVEYYPRPDLGPDNPLDLSIAPSPGRWRRALQRLTQGDAPARGVVELIRDVAPESGGYAHLIAQLQGFHVGPATTMAVVDVSSSYRSNLERVRKDLKELIAKGIVLSDEIIWFADAAIRRTGYLGALQDGVLEPAPDLGEGTRFGPALTLLEALDLVDPAACSLRIYTDSNFHDISRDDVLARLGRYADVKIIDFPL